MERELWPLLYRWLREVGSRIRQKDVTYQPWIIVAVLLWAALHDRPAKWACDPRNWSSTNCRPVKLPSRSVISRRGCSVGIALVWRALEERARGEDVPGVISFLDAKPLTVGGYSKDRDAKWGRAAKVFARGYKVHALWSKRSMPEAWDVTSLNVAETKVAADLLRQARRGGYVIADGNFDSSELFDVAAEAGYQLLTPAPPSGAGKGHHYQSPFRLRSIALVGTPFGRELLDHQLAIEGLFGNATRFGGGMAPLPAWVRRLRRVRTWVSAKLLINAARICRNRERERQQQRLTA